MEFKKVPRTANAEELKGLEWRLASVDEVNKSLEDIKKKRILRPWDIVRLLDGWIDGPGYGLNCVQEYKTGIGEMLLVKVPNLSGVKFNAKGREAALLLFCDDKIIQVIWFVIKSLLEGTEKGDGKREKELDKLTKSIMKKHGKGKTVMHYAADQQPNRDQAMDYAANQQPNRDQAMDYAADEQHYKDPATKVAFLLKEEFEHGINYLTARDKYGQTALHFAAFHGNPELCQFLIQKCKMPADETDEKGENLLHFAVRGKTEDVFKYFCLLSKKENIIGSEDAQGKTALHKTAGEGRNEKTKILLNTINDMEDRSFICQADLCGRTALHDATRTGDEEVVKELLTYGSNPLLERESDGKTALHYAVQLPDDNKAKEMARLLLEHHESNEEKSLLLWASAIGIGTAIETSVSLKNHKVQEYLEEERAKLTKYTKNLLKSAINVGNYNMAWELVNRGANPDDLTVDEMTKNRDCAVEFLEKIEKMPERGRDQPTIEDGLRRKHFVEGLAALFLNPYVKTPVTVGIFGDWGMGKSSLMIQTEIILLQTAAQLAFPNLLEKEEFPGSIEFSPTPNGSKKIDGIRHAIKRLQKGNSKSSTHDSADQDEDPLVGFLEKYQHKHHQVYRSLALMDRKDMFEVKNGRQDIDSNRHSLVNIPTVLTVRYNAWRYQDEKEAWAGLAVEIPKAIEESMTDAQRMRSRWRYAWKEHRNEIYFQLFLPSLLAVLLSCWVAWVLFTLFNRTKNRELLQLTYGSIPITIVLAVWTVVRQVLSVVKPVSDQIMGYLRLQDHGVNLGYQHQVISDINFSKQELGEKPSSSWRFIAWLWSLCGLFPETIKGTSIPKSPPPCEDDIRIIVFVDDLDRCEDTVILKVLSAVSLVLAVCEINVVLGMDMTMVKRAITNKFNDQNQKSPKDLALKYISKIIQLPLALPDANDDEMKIFLEQQLGPDLESGKLGDANVQKQSQGAENPDNSEHHMCLNILSEDHMCLNIFKRCRDFSSKTSDPQSENANGRQKKKLTTTLMRMLLLPNYSPKEREAIIYLGKEAAVSKRLPREWKGFLTYHRVAWNMLHRRPEVRNCPGWQVQLLVWIFCCWQWKDQINLIIKNWEKLVHRENSSSEPKVEENRKNEEDKDSHTRTKYSLGNIVQRHLEEEEAKQQHESEKQGETKTPVESEKHVEAETETEVGGKQSSEKGRTEAKNDEARTAARRDKEYMKKKEHETETEVGGKQSSEKGRTEAKNEEARTAARRDKEYTKKKEHDDKWKKLKEILIKYDVSMDCIQSFQKFRLHCKIKNLSRPSTGCAKERLRNSIPAGDIE